MTNKKIKKIKGIEKYSNKKILITGASNGIGAALLRIFLDAGATVYNFDKVAPTDAGSTKSHFIFCDLRNTSSIISATKKIKDNKIDVFISNAGIIVRDEILSASNDDALASYNIFVEGPRILLGNLNLSPKLQIVNISSMHAKYNDKSPGIYTLHKIMSERLIALASKPYWSNLTCYLGHVDTALTKSGKSNREYAKQKNDRISPELAASLICKSMSLNAITLTYDRVTKSYTVICKNK